VDANRETLPTRVRYGKWAGLYGSVIGIFVHQQFSSTWIYVRCPEHTLRFVLGFAITCALLSLATGIWSFSVRQSLRHDVDAHATTKTDRFIASMSAAMSVIGIVFIGFSAAAAWFLQCQR
jgi:hypothetical protein